MHTSIIKPSAILLFLALLVSGVFSGTLSAQTLRARAVFEPSVISAGQTGTYSVTIQGINRAPNLPPPEVNGLLFSDNASVGQQTQIVNGNVSLQATLTWRFAPQSEGRFTIAARTIDLGSGQELHIPEATVNVVPLSEREQSILLLEWDLPQKNFYVGEAIPVGLILYIAEGITVHPVQNTLQPERVGDGFLSTQFTEFRGGDTIERNGITYQGYAASTLLTPIQAGNLPLETQMVVVFSDPLHTRYTTGAFGQRRVREQQRLLAPPAQSLRILEPPRAGQLEGFNGAIGHFETTAKLAAEVVQAGEPIALTVELAGRGNFDRIAAPRLTDSEEWRIYPPKVSFEDKGDIGLNGTKRFEYLLVPRSENVTATPKIPFAAFDPVVERYRDLSVEPLAILVAPASRSEGATIFAGRPEAPAAAMPTDFRPNRADLGNTSARIAPIFLAPEFLASQGVLAFAFLGLFVWQRRRERLATDESYARQLKGSQALRQWAKNAREAAQRGDAEAFYAAAQRALQESVGRQFPRSRRPESLTQAEIAAVLAPRDLDPAVQTTVESLFRTGDSLRYARAAAASAESLATDAQALEHALRALTKAFS